MQRMVRGGIVEGVGVYVLGCVDHRGARTSRSTSCQNAGSSRRCPLTPRGRWYSTEICVFCVLEHTRWESALRHGKLREMALKTSTWSSYSRTGTVNKTNQQYHANRVGADYATCTVCSYSQRYVCNYILGKRQHQIPGDLPVCGQCGFTGCLLSI